MMRLRSIDTEPEIFQESSAGSAERLAALVARSDVHIHEILEVVSLDEALAQRLMKAANSAASATRMPIRTIKDAIVRLGSSNVLAIATAGNETASSRRRTVSDHASFRRAAI